MRPSTNTVTLPEHIHEMRESFIDAVIAAHGENELTDELWAFYAKAAGTAYYCNGEFLDQVDIIKAQFLPELSYSQIRKRLLAAMGYRSPIVANKLRQTYTVRYGYNNLICPSLWVYFMGIDYADSVFAHREGVSQPYMLSYLELLYEPVVKGYRPVESIAGDEFKQAFIIFLYLSKQKTMDMRGIRDQAVYIREILGCGHQTALNIAAMALGYSSWTEMLKFFVEESVNNRRYKWSVKALANDYAVWQPEPADC